MLIHMFDLIRFILGREPVEVVCWSWNPSGSPFKYDAAAAIMVRLAGGVVVTMRGNWMSREAPTPWAGRWRIQCDDGVIGFTSRGPAPNGLDDDRVVLRPLGGAETEVPLDPMPLYDRAGTLDAFAHALRGQPTAGWEATAADNLGSLRLMEAAIRSAAAGGAPTAVAPTAVAPTVVAPTAVAPTAVAPTAVAPTAVAPTAVAPTAVAPTAVAPTVVATPA